MKNRIKQIRKELGLTQSQLAELISSSTQQVQFLETGQRKLSLEWMEKIARALNIEMWYLIVDPKTDLTSRDQEIIARYNALDDGLKTAVDAILFRNKAP